ncbi:hypothetical protein [Acinetobacter sp. Ver3]|uniref:hypothetical protein n=1 Tax=Acinetobacter sp. Ver3 TaxID=466088 RepID=UPI000452107E|nr:hypothetical protein [Acinetobacter sp. Ver3]EZQ11660.1 hypothetical protein CL42_04195 [Acinetobacter sp. Ver3]
MKTNLSQDLIQNNPNTDFLTGDVVVYMNHIKTDDLVMVEAFQPAEYYWLEGGQLVHRADIRLATPAELKLKRRLTDAEMALAEVS